MTLAVRVWCSFLVVLFLAGCASVPKELPMDPSAAEPPVVFEMPEYVCTVEDPGITFVPDLPIDIFHFEGNWFWKIRNTWYWSKTYLGMLYELSPDMVPGPVRAFEETYKVDIPDCREFTYEDWNRRMKQQ